MRNIRFRGRRSFDKQWVYGNLVIDEKGKKHIVPFDMFYEDGHHLHYEDESDLPVFFDEKTIGQYTGEHDKNKKEVYEDDIIVTPVTKRYGVIQFSHGIFGINWDYKKNHDPDWKKGTMYGSWGTRTNLRCIDDGFLDDVVIIGNIPENPELLEERE